MPATIKDQLIAIIAAQAHCAADDITDDTVLQSLGLDSLRLVELVFAVEERFDISVPFAAEAGAKGFADLTLADLTQMVAGLIDQKAA
jgi:acyl carrier protein